MVDQLFFEDLTVGLSWQSPSKTLTDAHSVMFAGISGDNHPIHYDYDYASRTRFGKPIIHGLLVMGLTALGASEISSRLHDAMIALIEQGCRFRSPILVGDTAHPRFEVTELVPKGDRGMVTIAVRISNQRGELCLEGFHKYFIRCRHSE